VAFARSVTQAALQQGLLTQVNPVQKTPTPAPSRLPQEAANDGVYRWKMVAGLASFTAVLGVAWGVAGGVGQGGGAVLAVAPTAAPVVRVADSSAVWVSTPQGQVLRDARLQELMQTHRQLGGASALQAPAGFLRTSTLDAASR
jgi:sigma-E factor negative regulatory protein RseA